MKLFAVLWLFFISVLFFLPGQAIPKQGWLVKIYFDKWVHFGFFTVLLYLWRFYLPAGAKYNVLIFTYAFIYGLAVELIQHNLVTNRSFDWGDVLADMAGAFSGVWFWERRYIKK